MKWIKSADNHQFVWDGDSRIEIQDRRLKAVQESYFACTFCKADKVCRVRDTVCEDCLHRKDYKSEAKESNTKIRVKSFRDTVALGHDKETGEPIALDKRGKKFSPKETIYKDKNKDPYGWKATGKKVTDPEYGTPDYHSRRG